MSFVGHGAFSKNPMLRSASIALFQAIDSDHSGTIEQEEFEAAQQRLAEDSPITPRMGQLSAVDTNGDGRVDLAEWLHHMEGLLEVFGLDLFANTIQAQAKSLSHKTAPCHTVRVVSVEDSLHGLYTRMDGDNPAYRNANRQLDLQRGENGWDIVNYMTGAVLLSTRDFADRPQWIAHKWDKDGHVEAVEATPQNLPADPTFREEWPEEAALGKFFDGQDWKWIAARATKVGKWHLWEDGVGPQDLLMGNNVELVHQLVPGRVEGSAWLLSGIASLAEHPSRIRNLFVTQDFDSRKGKYDLKLWDYRSKKWETITVDEYLPCQRAECTDLGYAPISSLPNGYELWAILLEKALAKLFGGYLNVWLKDDGSETTPAGNPCAAFRACTGHTNQIKVCKGEEGWEVYYLAPDGMKWKRKSEYGPEVLGRNRDEGEEGGGPSHLWDYVSPAFQKNHLMAASMGTDFYNERKDGLVENVNYTIVQVQGGLTLSDSKKKERMICLRNPMGDEREWNGPWCDGDSMWSKHKQVREALDPQFLADGFFWMSFGDFSAIFDRIHICAEDMGGGGDGPACAKDFVVRKAKKTPKGTWVGEKPPSAGAGRIVTGSADCKVRFLDPASGTLDGEIPHDDWITALAFAPKGPSASLFATACRNGYCRVIDTNSGDVEAEINLNAAPMKLMWLPPTGRKIAIGMQDNKLITVNKEGGENSGDTPHGGPVTDIVCSADKKKMITVAGDGKVRIIDIVAGKEELVETMPGVDSQGESHADVPLTALAISPNGEQLVIGNERGRVAIMQTPGVVPAAKAKAKGKAKGKSKAKAKAKGAAAEGEAAPADGPPTSWEFKGVIRCLGFSEDGQSFAVGGDDGCLRVIKLPDGKIEPDPISHGSSVTCLAWGPGGQKIATGCADAKLRVVDATMGYTDYCVPHGGPVLTVAWPWGSS